MDLNVRNEGQEDYLAMVCAPDYNNMVTPSPHHYVNEANSFFPPTPAQLKHGMYFLKIVLTCKIKIIII